MERSIKSNNEKQFMGIAMLKQEQIFKEQVNELHRLYRIQKRLMENVKVNKQKQQHQQKLELYYNQAESSRKPFSDEKSKYNDNIVMGLNIMRHDHQVVVVSTNPRLSSETEEQIAESNGNNDSMKMIDDEGEIELTLTLGPYSINPRIRKNGKSESGQSIASSSTGSSQTRKTSPKENNGRISTIKWDGFTHQDSRIEPGYVNRQKNSNPSLHGCIKL